MLVWAVVPAAFAVPFGVAELAGEDRATAAPASSVGRFPLERTAETFEPAARTEVVRGLGAAAPLPELRRTRTRRARSQRPATVQTTRAAAPRVPADTSPVIASQPTRPAAPAPAPSAAAPAPAPVRPAPARPAPAPAAPARPAPDDFDSGESFDSTG